MRQCIIANFQRTGTRTLPGVDWLPAGWFVVSWRLVPGKARRRKLHGRWHAISNPQTGRRIFRILRFSSNLGGSGNNVEQKMVVDWPGWLVLDDFARDVPKSLILAIRPARWYELPLVSVRHPEPTQRLAAALGWLSLGLGLISIVLGLVSLRMAAGG